ncbi:hypothetical protein Tco_0010731 [Tanacetum coccineum]
MVRNPCVWLAPMNKMAGTPLGEMDDQTVVGSVHNSDHGAFASGDSCGGSLKMSDSSPLVSHTTTINMSRAGNHEELLSRMTNNMREAVMDALVAMCDLVQADNTNADASPCKVLHVDDSTIVEYGISIIVSQIGKHIMLDSYTSSMCIDSWGRSSFGHCLIEINAEDVLKESLTIGVPIIEDTSHVHDHCPKNVSIPIIVVTLVVPTPIVEMTNDGF